MSADCFNHRAGGIDWYCEWRGTGPYLVLIPSGEGDCGSFETVADLLSDSFTVLTFDTPGFSRTSAPPDPADVSMTMLAGQIATLVGSLAIDRATFYGCSSAGVAAFDLVRDHSDLVRNVIVHEAALQDDDVRRGTSPAAALAALDDGAIVRGCQTIFETTFNEDPVAWRALGTEYHERLAKNYVTWVRRYVAARTRRHYDAADLSGRPITWTIGGLTNVATYFSNVRLSHRTGIELGMLMCKHFPQVSIPHGLVEHIRSSTAEYL